MKHQDMANGFDVGKYYVTLDAPGHIIGLFPPAN